MGESSCLWWRSFCIWLGYSGIQGIFRCPWVCIGLLCHGCWDGALAEWFAISFGASCQFGRLFMWLELVFCALRRFHLTTDVNAVGLVAIQDIMGFGLGLGMLVCLCVFLHDIPLMRVIWVGSWSFCS